MSVGLGLDGDNARHLLLGIDSAWGVRLPADEDGVAGVPQLKDLEWNRGLAALTGDEGLAGGECWGAELYRC